MSKTFIAFVVAACFVAAYAHTDEATALPDMDPFPFKTYSGYLDIPSSTKSLHYYFMESQNAPADDPIVLWLNGGPGCSSMLGAATEHGYMVNRKNAKGAWEVNPYSWNKLANVIYLESPAGVGYSLLGEDNDIKNDDTEVAQDNMLALLGFFEKFPQYRTNEFYIAGESYAGIYVPFLAYYINVNNKSAGVKINIKGILVGNGATDWKYDCMPAMIDMAFTHGVVDDATTSQWKDLKCTSPNGVGLLAGGFETFTVEGGADRSDDHPTCDTILNKIMADMSNINMYNLYGRCEQTPASESQGIPCLDYSVVSDYFNRADVKKALNIPADAPEWSVCNMDLNENYTRDWENGSVWAYPILIEAGIKCHFYSGDVDLAVPYVGSQRWMDNMNLDTVKEWSQWQVDGQVAGFQKEYKGIKFVTVKGAGHMVPQDNSPAAYKILGSLLNGTDL